VHGEEKRKGGDRREIGEEFVAHACKDLYIFGGQALPKQEW
jgi:hypothetical protein